MIYYPASNWFCYAALEGKTLLYKYHAAQHSSINLGPYCLFSEN